MLLSKSEVGLYCVPLCEGVCRAVCVHCVPQASRGRGNHNHMKQPSSLGRDAHTMGCVLSLAWRKTRAGGGAAAYVSALVDVILADETQAAAAADTLRTLTRAQRASTQGAIARALIMHVGSTAAIVALLQDGRSLQRELVVVAAQDVRTLGAEIAEAEGGLQMLLALATRRDGSGLHSVRASSVRDNAKAAIVALAEHSSQLRKGILDQQGGDTILHNVESSPTRNMNFPVEA
jgi:non-ribosomal peptide synthetase component F